MEQLQAATKASGSMNVSVAVFASDKFSACETHKVMVTLSYAMNNNQRGFSGRKKPVVSKG